MNGILGLRQVIRILQARLLRQARERMRIWRGVKPGQTFRAMRYNDKTQR